LEARPQFVNSQDLTIFAPPVHGLPMTAPRKRLCVYCGSGPGHTPAYVEAARELGKAMAEAGLGLVYGGGSLGLMGETARAVLAAGGHVTGIIPEFLVNKERMMTGVNELIVTRNMHERKMSMFERSDGFVALPGGVGTLEELVEITTWAQLDQHRKPIIICNIENYWSPLLTLFDHMRAEKFIRAGLEFRMDVVDSAGDVVPQFEHRIARAQPSAIGAQIRKTV
jgi:uncharacterized protein (TIGR00730 family)